MTTAFKASIEPHEYDALTKAPEMFKHSFSYDERSQQIEFYTHDGAQLAKDLAAVIDPGETSWTEILH